MKPKRGLLYVRRYLGSGDQIRYRFGDPVVAIGQGEGYMAHLINEADFPARCGS